VTSPLRIIAVAVLAAAVLALSFVAAKEPAGPVVYDPDTAQPGAGKLEGETWSKESESAGIWLTRIDEETRKGFVRRRSGLMSDPFMASPGHDTGGFIAFHVLVENRTEDRLVFQAQACRLQTSWKEYQAPLDLPTIMAIFEMSERKVPEGIERIRSAIFDGEVVLKRGERRDGLFIFHALNPPPKRYQVDIGATLSGGDAFAFSAFYKKRKQ